MSDVATAAAPPVEAVDLVKAAVAPETKLKLITLTITRQLSGGDKALTLKVQSDADWTPVLAHPREAVYIWGGVPCNGVKVASNKFPCYFNRQSQDTRSVNLYYDSHPVFTILGAQGLKQGVVARFPGEVISLQRVKEWAKMFREVCLEIHGDYCCPATIITEVNTVERGL